MLIPCNPTGGSLWHFHYGKKCPRDKTLDKDKRNKAAPSALSALRPHRTVHAEKQVTFLLRQAPRRGSAAWTAAHGTFSVAWWLRDDPPGGRSSAASTPSPGPRPDRFDPELARFVGRQASSTKQERQPPPLRPPGYHQNPGGGIKGGIKGTKQTSSPSSPANSLGCLHAPTTTHILPKNRKPPKVQTHHRLHSPGRLDHQRTTPIPIPPSLKGTPPLTARAFPLQPHYSD